MKVAELIRARRRERGFSQRALARRAGVPQSTIGRIETGVLRPRSDTVEKILAALACELSVKPIYGEGIDRTLIRAQLALTPLARLEGARIEAANLAAFLDQARFQ